MSSNLRENAISLLNASQTQTVDLQNGDSKTTVYTVPTGKILVIDYGFEFYDIDGWTISRTDGEPLLVGAGQEVAPPSGGAIYFFGYLMDE